MWQNSLHWVGVGIFVSWASAKNQKKRWNLSTGFTEKEITIYSYYWPCNKNVGFWDLTLLFLDDTNLINWYVPNKVTKVLFHARNLCKAAGKIVAVSARWKTRGQGPGMGKRGVWKTWGVDNTGPKWKTRDVWKNTNKNSVCEQISSLSVALDEMPTATCEPSEIVT